MPLHKITRAVQCLSKHNLKTSQHRHIVAGKKDQIQIKLVVTSMIFHYSELHLSKYKGLSAVSMKQNTHFNFQPVSM
jgi:hypothetical protein